MKRLFCLKAKKRPRSLRSLGLASLLLGGRIGTDTGCAGCRRVVRTVLCEDYTQTTGATATGHDEPLKVPHICHTKWRPHQLFSLIMSIMMGTWYVHDFWHRKWISHLLFSFTATMGTRYLYNQTTTTAVNEDPTCCFRLLCQSWWVPRLLT